MFLNRFLILLGGCFLAASGAWADDVGFVDCANHSEDTQVFAKARKSPEVVSSVPCGERFTILVYGFVFSRIQTRDGNVGYVYSNIISVDRTLASAQKSATPQISDAGMKIKIPREPVERPAPAVVARTKPAPSPSAPAPASAQPSQTHPSRPQRCPTAGGP